MKKVILLLLILPLPALSQVVNRISPGKLVFTEIMADPLPGVSLPPEEYLEIYNSSELIADLTGWRLYGDDQAYSFPPVFIEPGQYLILCHISDTALFSRYGKVAPFKSFPALNNDGKLLVLTDPDGKLISGVEYSDNWYGNPLKSEGGWSLEITDYGYPFYGEGNWKASASKEGGTPGTANSIAGENRDPDFYGIENAYAPDSLTIYFFLSEPIPLGLLPGEIKISGSSIANIIPVDKLNRSFMATCIEPLKLRKIYTITLESDVKDFAGNSPVRPVFETGILELSCCNNLLFNELLFDPLPGGSDFIEVYNNSEKLIDLSQVSVSAVTGSDTSSPYFLSAVPRPLLPNRQVAFTEDRFLLSVLYPMANISNILSISYLPSMPDYGGTLVLFSKSLERLDVVTYSPELHNPVLASNEGVSLEKVRPSLPSSVPDNWHSASGTAGWATPGAINSVYTEITDNNSPITLSTSRVTPDYDGIDDVVAIDIELKGDNNAVSVTIFDLNGNRLKKVAENLYCGSAGTVIWDGTISDGTFAPSGIYIIYIESFDENGATGHWKKVVTVIRRR